MYNPRKIYSDPECLECGGSLNHCQEKARKDKMHVLFKQDNSWKKFGFFERKITDGIDVTNREIFTGIRIFDQEENGYERKIRMVDSK